MLHKTYQFWYSKNEFFHAKKMETLFGNLVRHSKMHTFSQCEKNFVIPLAWKSWIFVHGNSFQRTLFQDICLIANFLVSHATGHLNGTMWRFYIFWCCLKFSADFKMLSKLLAWPFISLGRILHYTWWISNEIANFEPKKYFL